MKALPSSDAILLVRTDFADDAAWGRLCEAVRAPDAKMQAALDMFEDIYKSIGHPLGSCQIPICFVDDSDYQNAAIDELIRLSARNSHPILLVADHVAMSHPDQAILVIDIGVEPGRSFRAVPSHIFTIESNLSTANMDWEDFAGCVEEDGVLRKLFQ